MATKDLSKELALRLADKFERGDIDINRMLGIIDQYFHLLIEKPDQQKVTTFIRSV